MSRKTNLFEEIARQGTDLHFSPRITADFAPTSAAAGSTEKINVLRWRLEHGLPLWHELDEKLAATHRQSGERFAFADCAKELFS